MWVLRGHHEFHPSELSKIKTIRIEKPMIKPPQLNREKYSGTAVLRMRLRGPVESYKMNRNKSDIYRDLFILTRKINSERTRLLMYIHETGTGSQEQIVVKTINDDEEEVTLFIGDESKRIETLNHEITATIKEA